MINTDDPLTAFVIALLDDDHGISEDAFDKLMGMLAKQGEADLWSWLDRNVKGGDDRVWLPSDVVSST